MNIDNIFKKPEPSRNVKREVERLAGAVQHGKLELRDQLCRKLGALAASYIAERKVSDSLHTLDEQIQLGEQLVEEGQVEMRQELLWSVAPTIFVARTLAVDDEPIDLIPFFKRFFHCYESLTEEEFCRTKNEWAMEMVDYAAAIEERSATPAAIAVLDETLKRIEQRFNPNKKQFTELNPFLRIYRNRGLWKYQIGDRTAAIDDLLQYEQYAIRAESAIQEGRNAIYEKSREFSEQDASHEQQYTIRIETEEYREFVASVHFKEDQYDTLFRLADIFAAGAEKEKALQYYDKSLAVLSENPQPPDNLRLLTYAAPAEIPFRKGTLLLQFLDVAESLEQFDLAIREMEKLLMGERDDLCDELENRYAQIFRYRSEALNQLKRFDEAKEALELSKEILARAPETLTKTQAARQKKHEKQAKSHPFMNLLNSLTPSQPAAPEKVSEEKALTEKPAEEKQSAEKPRKDWTEQDMLVQIGSTYNKASMEFHQGLTELRRGRCKTALKYLLKSRLVLDSPLVHVFPEAQMNLSSLYISLGRAYLGIEEYAVAETWYKRALKQAQQLVDEGYSEFQSQHCYALDGLGYLFAQKGDASESMVYFEKAYDARDHYIQFLESGLEGLDREKLRKQDHQRLMPIAKLRQEQVTVLRSMQEQLCRLNWFDVAIKWAAQEANILGIVSDLLPNPDISVLAYCQAVASNVAILLLQRDKSVDKIYERWVEQVSEVRSIKDSKTPEEIREILDSYVVRRLSQLAPHEELGSLERIFHTVFSWRRQGKTAEAEKLCDKLLAVAKKSQKAAENEHRFIRAFWDSEMEQMQDNLNMLLAKSDDFQDDDSDEYKKYERDFDAPTENHETLYQMLDKLTGGKSARRVLEKYHRDATDQFKDSPVLGKGKTYRNESPQTGRNDPCPCGSGKKYKKCCGK
ncbi:MAG: SEC-C domain-containing protein [Planctomycetaceae bacterium]|nr:SEC-C domain-containing protein [Planctomycetaceae bacterium]